MLLSRKCCYTATRTTGFIFGIQRERLDYIGKYCVYGGMVSKEAFTIHHTCFGYNNTYYRMSLQPKERMSFDELFYRQLCQSYPVTC